MTTPTTQDSTQLEHLYRAAKTAVATQNALAEVLAAHHAEIATLMRTGAGLPNGKARIVTDLQARLEEATAMAIQATQEYGAFAARLGLVPLPIR